MKILSAALYTRSAQPLANQLFCKQLIKADLGLKIGAQSLL